MAANVMPTKQAVLVDKHVEDAGARGMAERSAQAPQHPQLAAGHISRV